MSRFLHEIHEQPAALRSLLEYYRGEGAEQLRAVCQWCGTGQRPLLFTGMGSSYHAPLSSHTRLAAAGVRADLVEAGELLHYGLGLGLESHLRDSVLVAVSQSGESSETRQVVEALRGRCRIAAITNEPESAVGRGADAVLPMCAGEEAAISTKTYTNTLGLLHLLAALLTSADLEEELSRIDRVAAGMEAILAKGSESLDFAAEFLEGADFLYFVARGPAMAAASLDFAAEFLEGADFLYFVARGPAMAAAHQGALTFNEGARLPTCALAGGAFRHGPLELAGPDFSGVFLAPPGKTRDLIRGLAGEVAQAGGRVLLFGDEAPEGPNQGICCIAVPDLGEDLFSANVCLPLELLLYHVAQQRGHEAGVFERIGKVTRRE